MCCRLLGENEFSCHLIFYHINMFVSDLWMSTGWEECICCLLFGREGKDQNTKNMWSFWCKSLPFHWGFWKTNSNDLRSMCCAFVRCFILVLMTSCKFCYFQVLPHCCLLVSFLSFVYPGSCCMLLSKSWYFHFPPNILNFHFVHISTLLWSDIFQLLYAFSIKSFAFFSDWVWYV